MDGCGGFFSGGNGWMLEGCGGKGKRKGAVKLEGWGLGCSVR